MNKIQKIVFTMACLLTSLGGYSFKIVSMDSDPVGLCTVTATYNNQDVTAGTTDIPASNSNNVTIHISNITAGYYLDRIEYEYVTDLGQAEAPRRANGPGIQTKGIIPRNNSHITHYAGDYGLPMPASDIIITAIVLECTSISTYSLTLDGTATSLVYNGANHTVTLKNGETTLVNGQNYTVTTGNNTYKDVFSSSVTVTGCGIYSGTNTQELSITAKTLTIITDDGQSKVYGASDPVFTYTYSGLCSGDQITGALGRAAGENVGSYAINIGDLTAGSNYNIAFTPKDFVINAKDLSAMVTVTLNEEYHNYDGSQHQPIFNNESTGTSIVNYGNTRLVEGSDFTCSYTTTPGIYTNGTDYIKPDIYTITVTFKGNYTGTKTVEYQIRKEITLNSSNDYRWRTFYEQTYNMGKDDNYFLAYTIRDVTTNAVVLDGPTVIKAGVPMVLYRTSVTDSGIYPPLIKTTDSNLTGTIWTNAYSQYKCKVDDNGVPIAWDLSANDNIMILVDDKFVRSKSGTLAAGKCYLDVSSSSPSPAPSLVLEATPTGIEEIEMRDARTDNQFYDLSGRKISHPTKGLYIVNGKKIIIK